MAYDIDGLRRAMRHGHPARMLEGSPLHARAACRVVFSPDGFPVDGPLLVEIEQWLRPAPTRPGRRQAPDVSTARRRLRRHHEKLEQEEPPRSGVLVSRLDELADLASLGQIERDVLVLAGTYVFERLATLRARQRRGAAGASLVEVLSTALAKPPEEILAALAPSATLRSAKLLELGGDEAMFRLGESTRAWVLEEVDAGALEALVETVGETALRVADFAHAGLDAEILCDHLRAALDAGRATSVGLRGPRGSGRTELVRAIAAELDAKVLTLRTDVDELTASDLMRLRFAVRGAHARALLVVESDRASSTPPWDRRKRRPRRLADDDARGGLDDLCVPKIHMLAPREPRAESPFELMFLSEPSPQLDLTVEVPELPEPLRVQALARAASLDTSSPPAWLLEAAARGAQAASVEKHARIVKAMAHIEPAVAERQLAHLVGREGDKVVRPSPPTSALAYDAAWLRTDLSAERLLAAMKRSPGGRILLHGPPGTGKSRLARELARRGGLQIVSRTGSELLSKWLGGTEKNIAAAFGEASTRGALLLLDEVDSFLSARSGAMRSYEVTQVNELLVQIESFRGWLVCTTNFCKGLDEAAMRRFPIKVEFSPPDERQRRALFDAAVAALGIAEKDDERTAVDRILARAERLTPGDVAAVVEQVQILGGVESGLALAERLEREISYKGGEKKKVGFG